MSSAGALTILRPSPSREAGWGWGWLEGEHVPPHGCLSRNQILMFSTFFIVCWYFQVAGNHPEPQKRSVIIKVLIKVHSELPLGFLSTYADTH